MNKHNTRTMNKHNTRTMNKHNIRTMNKHNTRTMNKHNTRTMDKHNTRTMNWQGIVVSVLCPVLYWLCYLYTVLLSYKQPSLVSVKNLKMEAAGSSVYLQT